MAQPEFLVGGSTPRNGDPEAVIWVKILGARQNLPGADAANNPSPGDSLLQTLQKLVVAKDSNANKMQTLRQWLIELQ